MGETREHKIERLQKERRARVGRHTERSDLGQELINTVTRAVKLDTKITWQGHKLYGRRSRAMRTDLFEGAG